MRLIRTGEIPAREASSFCDQPRSSRSSAIRAPTSWRSCRAAGETRRRVLDSVPMSRNKYAANAPAVKECCLVSTKKAPNGAQEGDFDAQEGRPPRLVAQARLNRRQRGLG